MRRALGMAILALSLLFGAAGIRADEASANADALKSGTFDPPRVAPDFALQGSNGAELKLSDSRGKVVLLGFGFSACQQVCPITLGTLKQVNKKLGAQAKDVQVIYVTVDPEHDDVARLKNYLASFDPAFVGATGSDAQLAAVRRDYGVMAEKVAGPDGSFTHSSFVYLIDRDGRLRALMPFGHVADDYVHDVRILLASP